MCPVPLCTCRVLRLAASCVVFFAIGLVAVGSSACASPYQTSFAREITYLGAGGLLHLAAAIKASGNPAPTPADLENLKKDDLPAFDRSYAGRWDTEAETLSDVFLASSLVVPTVLMFSKREDAKTLGLMYAETLVLATGGANLSKAVAQRYRPFAYGAAAPLSERLGRDAKRSFFSGHSAEISASLVFAAKVYSDYHPGSRCRPYVWGIAALGVLSGSWLRVEAGWHFPSDALAGMAWGGLIGYSIPALHHRTQATVSIIPFVQQGQRGAIIVKRF